MDNRKLQSNMFQTLTEVTKVLETYDLPYLLYAGTLLGAVRHQGYIPWDDDTDICVPREKYNEVLTALHENLDSNIYFIQNTHTDKNFPHIFTRICLVDSIGVQRNWQHLKMEHKIFIDIFPLDIVDDLSDELEGKAKRIYKISTLRRLKAKSFKGEELHGVKDKVKQALKYISSWVLKIIPMTYLVKKQELVQINKDPKTENYVNLYGGYPKTSRSTLMQKERFYDPIKIEFEGEQFRAPKNYDEILKSIYGDYMEFPPENDRVGNHDFIKLKTVKKFDNILK